MTWIREQITRKIAPKQGKMRYNRCKGNGKETPVGYRMK
jgi:hypothetical protein